MVPILPKCLLIVLIVQIPNQIPRMGGAAVSGLCSMSPAVLPHPQSGPQSQAPSGAQRPHSLAPRPLGRSWGTLPGDPANPPFARAKRGLLFPTGPRGSRPNPANYRPHGGGARARPPLSHGREESPSVPRGEQSGDSAAPARPASPSAAPSLSSALVLRLCLPGLRGCFPGCCSLSCLSSLPVCVSSCPVSSLLPFLPVHSEALPVSLFPVSLPRPRFNLPAHLWVHLGAQQSSGPSFSSSQGPQRLGSLNVRKPRMLGVQAMSPCSLEETLGSLVWAALR